MMGRISDAFSSCNHGPDRGIWEIPDWQKSEQRKIVQDFFTGEKIGILVANSMA
jgi:hypothetical protein